MVESLLFIGAGAGAGTGEKLPGAGQKRTGSATLVMNINIHKGTVFLIKF